MNNSGSNMLTTSQERLLSKLVDGECNWFERWQAARLERLNPLAVEFVEDLKNIRRLSAELASRPHAPVDLWEKISNRIDQEERSALLIGKRQVSRERNLASVFDSISGGLTWGLSGAVAAMLVLFVTSNNPQSLPDQGNMQFAAGQGAGFDNNFSNVSLSQGGANIRGSAPQIVDGRYPATLEVDWMRSDGRVRVMPDAGDRSAIIWVKRRNAPAALPLMNRTPHADAASSWTIIDQNPR